ncbi:MAG TPA: alkane 1-monooxygenase [Aliidongia sp.]|nr:alkane 1-monooxygenase [Aliidongia sp.]
MRIALKQGLAALPITGGIPFLLLATVPLGYAIGLPCLAVLFFLLAFLVLDILFGIETEARPATGKGRLRALLARLPIWAYIPAQLGVILWGAKVASHEPHIAALLGLALATGAAAGIFGMLAAHEMIHSRSRGERALGLAMLAGVGYMHFRISHLHGHHSFAGTHEDPATARRGEGAYRFILRSITGQVAEAWRFERRRTARRRWPLLANRMVQYALIMAAVDLGALLAFGPAGLVFQLVQTIVAIVILELFNYIAHYGLARRRNAAGRLEAFGTIHSWNALPRFNNWALFNGGHHADHHRQPAEPYQHLRLDPTAPELPFGFAASILLATVPPLWRRVMDPRVDYWQARPST